MLPADGHEIQVSANVDINTPRKDWLERLATKCREKGGFNEAAWKAAYDDILAASDVIRYVHLGNPECIMVSDENVVRRAMYESGVSDDGTAASSEDALVSLS